MRCDTCGNDSAVVQRVVIAKDYDRSMARPLYNCPSCYEKKEQAKPYQQQTQEQRSR